MHVSRKVLFDYKYLLIFPTDFPRQITVGVQRRHDFSVWFFFGFRCMMMFMMIFDNRGASPWPPFSWCQSQQVLRRISNRK